jgi:hypothetical protein
MNNPDYSDFRLLCADLIKIVEEHCNPDEYALLDVVNVLSRARAALAQPEPEPPTDEELMDLWTIYLGIVDLREFVVIARAVLARWGTPANNTREANQ